MDNKLTAIALSKLSEQNRSLLSDELVKANAPNAKDLCSGRLDFASAFNEIASRGGNKSDLKNSEISSIIGNHIQKSPITKSVRESSADLAQAYVSSMAMMRLVNHFYKQDRSVIDNFRPQ